MLEALFLFCGGAIVAEVVGVLLATDSAVKGGERAIVAYGQRVADKTAAACDERAAIEIQEVSRDITGKATAAISELSKRHEAELDQAVVETARAAQQETIRSLAAAGLLKTPE